jgi:hypothetical protein
MNKKDFESVVVSALDRIGKLLTQKGIEYSRRDDVFHAFRRAALTLEGLPEEALLGFAEKHRVSIGDMVRDIAWGGPVLVERMTEKIEDLVAYLILLEGMILERNQRVIGGKVMKGEEGLVVGVNVAATRHVGLKAPKSAVIKKYHPVKI